MKIDMARIEIAGLKTELEPTLRTLRDLGCVHVDDITETPGPAIPVLTPEEDTLRVHEIRNRLLARVDGLIETLSCDEAPLPDTYPENYLEEARQGVDDLAPQVKALIARRESLEAERASLPRYEATLRKLQPDVPPRPRHSNTATRSMPGSRP